MKPTNESMVRRTSDSLVLHASAVARRDAARRAQVESLTCRALLFLVAGRLMEGKGLPHADALIAAGKQLLKCVPPAELVRVVKTMADARVPPGSGSQ
jgi:hypothetical protein